MSRNEDVTTEIWTDPDFFELSFDAKGVYLWSFTNEHNNMAGLYRIGLPTIAFETKLPPDRLQAALDELTAGDFLSLVDNVMFVRTRVKRLRQKTSQIARSIAKTVERFAPDHPQRVAFLQTYRGYEWLVDHLEHLIVDDHAVQMRLVEAENPENIDVSRPSHGASTEAPGTGTGQRSGLKDNSNGRGKSNPDPDVLPDDFPDELEPVASEVLPILLGVHSERGGNLPTLRSVGLSLRRFPRRDHVGVARDLEHWTLAGLGRSRPLRDVGKLYATFLQREPEGTPMRVLAPTAEVEDSAAFLARRGAA